MYRHLTSARRRVCPRCGAATESRSLAHKVTGDVCRECNGVWLDHGELKKLLRARVSERAHPRILLNADRTDSRCPGCGVQLLRREFTPGSGVVIEQCSRCAGIFLDRRELARLQDFLISSERKRR